jgi:hypothetical protein
MKEDREKEKLAMARKERKLEKLKAPEAIFSYGFSTRGIKDINEHILLWVTCKEPRENFDGVGNQL